MEFSMHQTSVCPWRISENSSTLNYQQSFSIANRFAPSKTKRSDSSRLLSQQQISRSKSRQKQPSQKRIAYKLPKASNYDILQNQRASSQQGLIYSKMSSQKSLFLQHNVTQSLTRKLIVDGINHFQSAISLKQKDMTQSVTKKMITNTFGSNPNMCQISKLKTDFDIFKKQVLNELQKQRKIVQNIKNEILNKIQHFRIDKVDQNISLIAHSIFTKQLLDDYKQQIQQLKNKISFLQNEIKMPKLSFTRINQLEHKIIPKVNILDDIVSSNLIQSISDGLNIVSNIVSISHFEIVERKEENSINIKNNQTFQLQKQPKLTIQTGNSDYANKLLKYEQLVKKIGLMNQTSSSTQQLSSIQKQKNKFYVQKESNTKTKPVKIQANQVESSSSKIYSAIQKLKEQVNQIRNKNKIGQKVNAKAS